MMLHALAGKQKAIAWFFTIIFYLQLIIVPAMTRAADNDYRPLAKHTGYYPPVIAAATPGDKPQQPAGKTHREDLNTLAKSTLILDAPSPAEAPFTTGPTQPEMQSFQSVNASNMVDLFTGDFSYNIPLLDVGGYPVNLHYNSGVTMDQEASWVGLGWNINPGTITRNMRGLPDDFKEDDKITKTVSMKPNKTVGITTGANVELLGMSQSPKKVNGSLGASIGVFHNTYKGWGTEYGISTSINAGIGSKGSLTSSLGITNNSQNGLDVSPSMGFTMGKSEGTTKGNITIGTNYNSRTGIQNIQITGEIKQSLASYNSQRFSTGVSIPSYISFAKPSYTPTIRVPYTSSQVSFTAKVGTEHWGLHPSGFISGYASTQKVETDDQEVSLPAYGYLYYDKAAGKKNALLDFNREKDISFSEGTPHIAMPVYTYDTYSVSGEGTGGMFRPYRGDIGYVYDPEMTTKSNSDRLSVDVGFGTIVHGGIDFYDNSAFTRNGAWLSENALKDIIGFRPKDSTYENVYFKNPGEKTAVVNRPYLDMIGDDNLVRVDLSPLDKNPASVFATRNLSVFSNGKFIQRKTLNGNIVRSERDKRTQVISYLTADQAAKAGLDTLIKSYGINVFPSSSCSGFSTIDRVGAGRQKHHISEVDVLNGDGRRYVYGIPVYNAEQIEVSMSTDTGTVATGLVSYAPGTDNSVNNNKGKEHYFNKERIPAYSHSFLLTGILSPDYSDLTGDGITEDDNGEAVKFNYSQVYSIGSSYKWRAPYLANRASYNEGLKTDNRDEKGSYTYGSREVWYLNSIESKTMVATFLLETDSIRKDGYGVNGENGGLSTSQKLYRLKQINLYTKADYLQHGTAAKPIKSVHFAYSYELCPNNPGSLDNTGKLTLKKVWFTYNKNNKGALNPYVFTYHAKNPAYSSGASDRWGNYKNPSKNPGAGTPLSNADYAYTLQEGNNWNSDSAAAYAAPWALAEIGLPSRGKIKVTYESDDYAYVQNKRAMQLFTLAGLGDSPTGTIDDSLYKAYPDGKEFLYVFANVTDPVTTKAELQRKYLEGVNQLFFKIAVNMPADIWGKGYEFVPCYADIEDYGVRTGGDNKTIWIKIKPITGTQSPLVTAAIQFLRLNLPSKAYPYSEPGDDINLRAALGMLGSIAGNLNNAVNGFRSYAKGENRCITLAPDKSFVRLDNPLYKKFGGGLRVKRVEIKDNWDTLTAGQQQGSVYGQDYDYTATEMINGVPVTISSGVATYEPAVGNDENPFRVPHKVYTEKVGALAPVDYLYTEEPFGETFFPAPIVGYSHVRVQTIHKTRKSANGFTDNEFYTSRDFPTLVEFTPLDGESKKPFNPALSNLFKFDAHHHITLSQGFKIELNDMNGKVKSQASYAQTDLKIPVSYTYNYYRLENDNALRKKLSNKVTVADSANGVLRYNAEIGKEVEIMIDLREQVSITQGVNVEANVDFVHVPPPISWFSAIPLPTRETNLYRSVAVTKIVNRYGILDSVIHSEKGSKVTSRDLVYDAETGAALLTQTNNEFDDPVYSFNYPAHWAYSGMGPAYKNIGTILTNKRFRQGILMNANNVAIDATHFESGDEILVKGRDQRVPFFPDTCTAVFYIFKNDVTYTRIWAIDAAKGYEQKKGIYFIDKDGMPYSGNIDTLWIVRSGRRNLSETPVGSIASLSFPIKNIGGKDRLVIDSTANILSAGAARFKDMWKIDNVWRQYDSCVVKYDTTFKPVIINSSAVLLRNSDDLPFPPVSDYSFGKLVASYTLHGSDQYWTRALIKPDLSGIPAGSIITNATLNLYGAVPASMWPFDPYTHPSMTYSYDGFEEPLTGKLLRYPYPWDGTGDVPWVGESTLNSATTGSTVLLPYQGNVLSCVNYKFVNVTGIIQDMMGRTPEYQNMLLKLQSEARTADPGDDRETRFMSFQPPGNSLTCNESSSCTSNCPLELTIDYASPRTECYKVCRSEVLNKDTINPYRYGILGNWRLDTAYTYYAQRKAADPATGNNIRTGGTIKDFLPFWKMGAAAIQANGDNFRWVWNSKSNLFNGKGAEIENKDALLRYNAGLYGYNKTLAVAVAQNSKNREIVFEGFEDQGYNTNSCITCNTNGWINTKDGGLRNSQNSHTGQYSFRINGNTSVQTNVPLVSEQADTASPHLSLQVDSLPLVSTAIVPKGTGLFTQYGIWFARTNGDNSCVGHNITGIDEWSATTAVSYPAAYWPAGTGPSQVCAKDYFVVKWTGKLQPQYTGSYVFFAHADDQISVKVNNTLLFNFTDDGPTDENSTATPLMLTAGQLYDIEVVLRENQGDAVLNFTWARDNGLPEPIPLQCLYQTAAQANGSIINDTTWCVKFRSPKQVNAIHDKFSPILGHKMLLSAWVKEEVPCVNGSNYASAQIRVTFNHGSPVSYTLKPQGAIIEGWQRIEGVVDIPNSISSQMSVYLETATSTAAFFDDIRLQPFNANMKSFVYDPVNLRLVAELDENNHATFYEYDDEGTLVRLKKETERGIKTIKETRSALSKPLNP